MLAVVGVGVLSWQARSSDDPPATSNGRPGIPDRIWQPSDYLPGTDGHPLGQLAAILPSVRSGRSGPSNGWVGISATTGEYRFLDLPGAVDVSRNGLQVSPDGRHVAYWASSSTSFTSERGPVTAIAVYDALTGKVRRREIASKLRQHTTTVPPAPEAPA